MSILITSKVTGKRVLFSWIPKTGGTSIVSALNACSMLDVQPIRKGESQHAIAPCYAHRWEWDFHFCCVRHPLTWWASVFLFWRAHQWRDFEADRWVPGRPLLECASDDFKTFIGNVIVQEPAFYARMVEWYVGPPGDQWPGVVLRQESLNDQFREHLEQWLGVGVVLPTLRASQGEVEWTSYHRKTILQLEGPMIRRFGY